MTREQAMVPEAEFRSYYGQPVIKAPIWHEPHMPVYLYLGGLSGAASTMAAAALLSGHDRLGRTARVTAVLGAVAGAGCLVAELGRPERFFNMLRVFKPTSPMSMGSWTLAAHSALTSLALAPTITGALGSVAARSASRSAASRSAVSRRSTSGFATRVAVTPPAFAIRAAVTPPAFRPARGSRWSGGFHGALSGEGAVGALVAGLPVAGDAAVVVSALTGPLMATYTAVLLADTAVPAWHAAHRELPFLFAGSALASAGAAGMLGTPAAQAGPARATAVLGAAVETVAGAVLERRLGLVGEPYGEGRAGRLLRAARALTVGGGLLAAVAGRSRPLAAMSGLALTAGALCTRFGVLAAGRASAADPKYTVVPQRRLAEEPEETP
ncbi:NrfD/PsrC family molybdoenzyme membrane anchor subunit [Streptosporangium soli]|nr:polysulfide reductase NrfD [Streptosporangium sp. KLBMP 9127]